jgi:hypothetical protein
VRDRASRHFGGEGKATVRAFRAKHATGLDPVVKTGSREKRDQTRI